MPSNVQEVIDSVDDVKDDLRKELRRHVSTAMRALEEDARTYIKRDAGWRGHLSRSLDTDVRRHPDGAEIVVSVGGPKAPYAPFVEFGTGTRTDRTTNDAPTTGIIFEPDQQPPSYPYSSPDMAAGMVANIISWVETKPIAPEGPLTPEELGYRIAATIAEKGTYAHPFLRPAWFHNELTIKQAARNGLKKATT